MVLLLILTMINAIFVPMAIISCAIAVKIAPEKMDMGTICTVLLVCGIYTAIVNAVNYGVYVAQVEKEENKED